MNTDEIYMARALQLALLGRGNTAPNPMVGAVVVYEGKIIGEGFHRRCGQAHAEVNAIASVRNPELLSKSTIYVSLEPCSHWGKTPPCAQLIIDKKIPKVVVGVLDPYVEVAGRGIKMLQQAGCEVKVGVLEKECREVNRAFFTVQQKHRPYIILKWAQSADGFIDKKRESASEKMTVISDAFNSILVHKLRSEVDAIMVGPETANLDNPQLNVRKWQGRNPLRVLLDRNLRVTAQNPLLDGSLPTLVFTLNNNFSEKKNVEYVVLNSSEDFLEQVISELQSRKIQTLLVEGGAAIHQNFIVKNLWDEARIETSMAVFGQGVRAAQIQGTVAEVKKTGESEVKRLINRQNCAIGL